MNEIDTVKNELESWREKYKQVYKKRRNSWDYEVQQAANECRRLRKILEDMENGKR